MEIGKLAGKKLKDLILNKLEHFRDDVIVPAGPGEDSSVIDFGDRLLVMSSDPITGAGKNAGYLAVNIACNDIAATGAEPIGIQVILLLPPSMKDQEVSELMEELVRSSRELNVEILGGHTEILDIVTRPIINITAIGQAKKNQYLASRCAKEGDILYATKGIGLEGAYILANDFTELLLEAGVEQKVIIEAQEFANKISVIEDSQIAVANGARALHDITEGGLYGAVYELAQAAGLGFELDLSNVKVPSAVKTITDKLGLDPAGLISSGSLLIAAAADKDLISHFRNAGIEIFALGKLTKSGYYITKNQRKERFHLPEKDELWNFMDKNC